MQRVEKHVFKKNHEFYAEIDKAAFLSKNLYNAANYMIRQNFFETGKAYSYMDMHRLMKDSNDYKALPRKVSQQVLRVLDKNWKSYFKAIKAWKKNPAAFLGLHSPKLPGYKDKEKGRNILVYTEQAISKKLLKQGIVKPSGLSVEIQTKQNEINQVRIVPKSNHYVVEVVYTICPEHADLDYSLIAGIDLGVNNLATIASNKPGYEPRLINGRTVKSVNQFYNKKKADVQSKLEKEEGKKQSDRIERMTDKRNHRVDHYLHAASKAIVDHLVNEQIGVLAIGKNDGWKQEINIGKRNNQNFVQIPHAKFIEMITYKAEMVGIQVQITEESYTSKTSFLDHEPIQKHEKYAGRRVKRGMFKSKDGTLINADLNGALNIIRKVAPGAFAKGANGVEGVVVRPLPLPVGA